jgi:hypothetical protein
MNPTLRKYLILVGAAVVLLATAFAVGRYTVPTKIETKEVQVEKQVVVTKIDDTKLEQLIEQNRSFQSQLSELKKSIHREKWAVTHVDGSKEEKSTEDINISRTVQTTQIQYVDRVETKTETKYVDRVVEKEKVVEKTKVVTAEKPQWDVKLLVGADLKNLAVAQGLTTGPFTFGAEVDRRILGPIKVGVFGLSNGTVGAGVGVEF